MATIHVIVRGGGRILALMMMRFDRALGRGAARAGVGRPGSGGDGRIEQEDREQAEDCGEERWAMARRSLHVLLGPISVVRHYSVTRHSLQAGLNNLRLLDNSLYAESAFRCITG